MFKDNKLRLLMTLVGFMRLGANDDPDASWVIPSSVTSVELQEAIDLIRKFEFDPPIYENGKGPEDFLRSAAAARRSRRAEFDDDSDGVDHESEEDRGEYTVDDATSRKPDGERKKLKRRKRAHTPVELDDEERDARAEARRKKEIEKQAKTKSTMFVHDSDDEEWDADKDAAFFAREQALREETMDQFKNSLVLGIVEPAVSKKDLTKKRKAEDTTKKTKRRKSPPKRKAGPFDDSDEDEDMDDAVSVSSRAPSEEAADESEDEATDTPLSSQHAGSKDETPKALAVATSSKTQDAIMVDDDDDDEDVPVARRPVARNTRAGFIIDSDSE
jgi:replication fork protection complex subunit Tof1/Swi1